MGRPKRDASENRSSTVSLRLDERTRYGLDLLARRRKKNLSYILQEAIFRAFEDEREGLVANFWDGTGELRRQSLVELLWAPDRYMRLLLLGAYCPYWLSGDEAALFHLILDNPNNWKDGHVIQDAKEQDLIDALDLDRVREFFEQADKTGNMLRLHHSNSDSCCVSKSIYHEYARH